MPKTTKRKTSKSSKSEHKKHKSDHVSNIRLDNLLKRKEKNGSQFNYSSLPQFLGLGENAIAEICKQMVTNLKPVFIF
jgi:hypothetical protein